MCLILILTSQREIYNRNVTRKLRNIELRKTSNKYETIKGALSIVELANSIVSTEAPLIEVHRLEI